MRLKRIITGLLLGSAGVIFTIVAVFIAQAAQDQNRLTEKSFMTADMVCREQAQRLGAIKELEAGRVWELTVPVVVEKRTALGDASAVIAACPTRTMRSFCLGSGCNDPQGTRPPATQVRRPASMIMQLVLRPGAVAAQAVPAAAPRAPTPAGSQMAPRPGQPTFQQPARPHPQQQPARPVHVAPQVK